MKLGICGFDLKPRDAGETGKRGQNGARRPVWPVNALCLDSRHVTSRRRCSSTNAALHVCQVALVRQSPETQLGSVVPGAPGGL